MNYRRNLKFYSRLAAAWGLVVFSFAANGQGSMDMDQQILTELNQGYLDAYRSGDVEFFDRVLADDFRETAPDGTILNKAEFLAKIGANASADPGQIIAEAGELEIRIFGDTAIVHAIPILTMPDGSTVVRGRYTDVYARIEGEWLCVAAHLGGG